MANSGPGQNATVEEILASIRQAISEDDARRTISRRPDQRALAERRPVARVTRVLSDDESDGEDAADEAAPMEDRDIDGDVDAAAEGEAEDDSTLDESAAEPNVDQGIIEMAIEQALDGARAELAGRRTLASRLRPRQELVRTPARSIPRAPRLSAPRREGPASRRALLSASTDAEVSASFDELAKAMIEGNAGKLDAVVEDLLRPMLKTWLESNLPQMVERLVREEIERVARGRR